MTADRPDHLRLLPGPISSLQLLFAVCFCVALQLSGALTFQKVTSQQVKMYSIYALLFVGSVYASMKSLLQNHPSKMRQYNSSWQIQKKVQSY